MAWVFGFVVFLVLLWAFPRTVIALGVAAVLAAGGFAFWIYWSSEREVARVAAIGISVFYAPDRCGAAYPLRIEIRNGARQALRRLDFSISGYRPGYSSSVVGENYSTDRILRPGEIYSGCWSLASTDGVNLGGLTWSARASMLSSFYERGEAVPPPIPKPEPTSLVGVDLTRFGDTPEGRFTAIYDARYRDKVSLEAFMEEVEMPLDRLAAAASRDDDLGRYLREAGIEPAEPPR